MQGKTIEFAVKGALGAEKVYRGKYETMLLNPVRFKICNVLCKEEQDCDWESVEGTVEIVKSHMTKKMVIIEEEEKPVASDLVMIANSGDKRRETKALTNSEIVQQNDATVDVVRFGLKHLVVLQDVNDTKYTQAIDHILGSDTVFIVAEGVDMGRDGSIDLLAVYINEKGRDNYLYIFDVHTLDYRRCWSKGMGDIFEGREGESRQVLKVMHNCRPIADYLHFINGISLDPQYIFDTQAAYAVVQLQESGQWPDRVLPLNALLHIAKRERQTPTVWIRASLDEDKLVWQRRPLSNTVINSLMQACMTLYTVHKWLTVELHKDVTNAVKHYLLSTQKPKLHMTEDTLRLLPGSLLTTRERFLKPECDCKALSSLKFCQTASVCVAPNECLSLKYSKDIYEAAMPRRLKVDMDKAKKPEDQLSTTLANMKLQDAKFLYEKQNICVEEGRMVEYKAHRTLSMEDMDKKHSKITGDKINRTKQPVSKTINAMLNGGQGGQIYLGVLDDGTVIGFRMNLFQRDHMVVALDDILSRYTPPVPKGMVHMTFIPVLHKAEHLSAVEQRHKKQEMCELCLFRACERFERAHIVRTFDWCWCDLQSCCMFNEGLLEDCWILLITVQQNEDGTVYQNEEGLAYTRRICSNSQLTLDLLKNTVATKMINPLPEPEEEEVEISLDD